MDPRALCPLCGLPHAPTEGVDWLAAGYYLAHLDGDAALAGVFVWRGHPWMALCMFLVVAGGISVKEGPSNG